MYSMMENEEFNYNLWNSAIKVQVQCFRLYIILNRYEIQRIMRNVEIC